MTTPHAIVAGATTLNSDIVASDMLRVKLAADQNDKIDKHKVYGRLLEEHFDEVIAALQEHHQAKNWQALAGLVEKGNATVVFIECKSIIPASEATAQVEHTGRECGTVGEIVDELELAAA